MAEIIAAAPLGAIDVCGLRRTEHIDELRARCPWMTWPATHAAAQAVAAGRPVLTVKVNRYANTTVDALAL